MGAHPHVNPHVFCESLNEKGGTCPLPVHHLDGGHRRGGQRAPPPMGVASWSSARCLGPVRHGASPWPPHVWKKGGLDMLYKAEGLD